MGEERGAETPFLYFTSFSDPDFAAKVVEGRRSEFAAFHEQGGAEIPDPNQESTFAASRLPPPDTPRAQEYREFYRELLALRREHIVPELHDCACESVDVVAEGCVVARWVFGNGVRFALYCNLFDETATLAAAVPADTETVFYESRGGVAAALLSGLVPGQCTIATLAAPHGADAGERS